MEMGNRKGYKIGMVSCYQFCLLEPWEWGRIVLDDDDDTLVNDLKNMANGNHTIDEEFLEEITEEIGLN